MGIVDNTVYNSVTLEHSNSPNYSLDGIWKSDDGILIHIHDGKATIVNKKIKKDSHTIIIKHIFNDAQFLSVIPKKDFGIIVGNIIDSTFVDFYILKNIGDYEYGGYTKRIALMNYHVRVKLEYKMVH